MAEGLAVEDNTGTANSDIQVQGADTKIPAREILRHEVHPNGGSTLTNCQLWNSWQHRMFEDIDLCQRLLGLKLVPKTREREMNLRLLWC
jgi:hypothetical protein